MKDTLLTIAAIVVTGIGLPLLIVWMNNRFRVFGAIIRVVFGSLACIFGLVIIIWIIYNLFRPTVYFQDHVRSPFAYVVPFILLWFGWKWLSYGGQGLEEQEIDFDAPELRASVQYAQASLPFFIEKITTGATSANIKYPFVTDTGQTEHVWGLVEKYEDHSFHVEIVSEPVTQEGPLEKMHIVPEANVEDWQYLQDDGRIKGGYSCIGAFQYLERNGVKLNRTMKAQRAQYADAE